MVRMKDIPSELRLERQWESMSPPQTEPAKDQRSARYWESQSALRTERADWMVASFAAHLDELRNVLMVDAWAD